MSKEMIITVGTSLYHSASWQPEGPLAEVKGYKRWTESTEHLTEPSKREYDQLTAGALAYVLDRSMEEGQIAQWTGALPARFAEGAAIGPDEALRYSGEITTLIRLALSQQKSLRELLDSYDNISIPIDTAARSEDQKRRRRSYVAGRHLVEYLNTAAGEPICSVESIAGLASPEPQELGPALQELFKRVANRATAEFVDELDVIVTGGYKVYGYLLARLIEVPGVRLLYLYEGGDSVLQLDRETVWAITPGRKPQPFPIGFERLG